MKRVAITERPDWRQTAEKFGFRFADMYGARYWDESAMFSFRLCQIEDDIEEPTRELHQMCLALADKASADARLLALLGIPDTHHDYVANSWRAGERSLYARFDFAYDGTGPAKMLEYNADTPTGLYETGAFQWIWLEHRMASGDLPADADQFNSVHDQLVSRFATFPTESIFHFAGAVDSVEDVGTLTYLMDCAQQAGQRTKMLDVKEIGVDAHGRFTDLDDLVIDRVFKLYPWEWMFDVEYSAMMADSGCAFVEPAWKAMLSTKAILPLLWEMFPGHPNLLPSFFDGDERASAIKDYVRKPLFSREGANVTLVRDGKTETIPGPYGEDGFVIQEAARLFESEHGHAVIGSWVVGDEPAGMGIREDSSAITMDMSRFIPHVIEN